MKSPTNYALIEENPEIRSTIIDKLQQLQHNCTLESSNLDALFRKTNTLNASVLLIDIKLVHAKLNDILNLPSVSAKETKVILTTFNVNAVLESVLSDLGVYGIIDKHALFHANFAQNNFVRIFAERKVKFRNCMERISERELKIIGLKCLGKTNKEIADYYGIGIKRIERALQKIYDKLNVSCQAQFYKIIFENGLNYLVA